MTVFKKIGAALILCAMPMAFGCLTGEQDTLLEAPSADQVGPSGAVMGHAGLSEDAIAADTRSGSASARECLGQHARSVVWQSVAVETGCCQVGSNCGNSSAYNCSLVGGTFYPGKSCMQPCGLLSGCCR